MTDQRKEIDLPAGRIRYREAGAGKPIVFVHGYLVDGRLWDGVVDALAGEFRCIAADWLAPAASDRAVRRDLKKVTIGMNKRYTLEAAEKLRGSRLPILLAWAPGDRYFPISYAERLAGEAGNARIVPIAESKTFVPLDQPQRLAEEISQFAATG